MFLCIELVAKYAGRIGGVRWMCETIWLDEKNKKTAKQVAAVLAEAKATCSDVPGHSAGRLGLSGRYGLRGWRRVTASARCGSMDVLSARAARLTTAQAG